MDNNNPKRIKILVVEDDPFINIILKRILGTSYDVTISNTVVKAFSCLHGGDIPDLIISDYNMPQLSGLDLLIQLQASDFFKSLPVMILSGEDSSDIRIKCLDNGADDYVIKPFNPLELLARIRSILRRMEKSKRL